MGGQDSRTQEAEEVEKGGEVNYALRGLSQPATFASNETDRSSVARTARG